VRSRFLISCRSHNCPIKIQPRAHTNLPQDVLPMRETMSHTYKWIPQPLRGAIKWYAGICLSNFAGFLRQNLSCTHLCVQEERWKKFNLVAAETSHSL